MDETSKLPGGDIEGADFTTFFLKLTERFSTVDPILLSRLARRYGTRVFTVLDENSVEPGRVFANLLCEAEVANLVKNEWVTQADDILWRRTKAGLHMNELERAEFKDWFAENYKQ